jgi:stage IV sporulation protein B
VGHDGFRIRRALGAAMAAAIFALDLSPAGRHLLRLPSRLTVAVGQRQGLVLGLPGRVAVAVAGDPFGLWVDGHPLGARWQLLPGGVLVLNPRRPGSYLLRLRPLGVLPWPPIQLVATGVPQVHLGGQSVGVELRLRGALVVGESRVPTGSGGEPSPLAAAGVGVGAYLLQLDGWRVHDAAQVADVLAQTRAAPLSAVVLVRGAPRLVRVQPAYDPAIGRYSLGAAFVGAVRGIGTLTFYAGRVFGALGHVVLDEATGRAVRARGGLLLPSLVAGVQPSRDGAPGEKLGMLLPGGAPIGVVLRNTAVGVFGRLLRRPAGPPGEPTLPVALPDQVHPGPARLLTVVRGVAVSAFSVRIVAVDPGGPPGGRGLTIEVTDPRLLEAAGGIVQGMSGSPLVQDGRLVGALTHVFVDDPASGYGVLASWMAQAAGLLQGPGATGRPAAAGERRVMTKFRLRTWVPMGSGKAGGFRRNQNRAAVSRGQAGRDPGVARR